MAKNATGALFSPSLSKPESKQQVTNNVVRTIIDAEVTSRDAKTARLKAMRLQKEAEELAAAPAAPPPKKRASRAKRAV